MGQKMVRFGALRGTRSRQDESMEVGEVGSKRPSSGGNGGHVLSLYPLIWRSLTSTMTGRFVDTVRRRIGTAIDSTNIQKPKSNNSPQASWRR